MAWPNLSARVQKPSYAIQNSRATLIQNFEHRIIRISPDEEIETRIEFL